MLRTIALVAVASLGLSACQDQASGGQGGTRSEIRIVGSSTVFPFAKAVAEQFSINGANPSPILESTGTGGGMSLFCAGVGADTPDIANASRRIKASEFELCQSNGVTDIIEVQIGIDGIAVAQANNGPAFSLTPAQIYEAIAARPYGKENKNERWSDIDSSLPDFAISVYGPPSTSGTRDALTELIMEVGCTADSATKALKDSDEEAFKDICHEVRTDGGYVDAGENDNLIVQKLKANPNSVGIFGFSFLEENLDSVRGISVSGVKPTYDAIASGNYPGARPLYVYVKKQHVGVIPGLREYMLEFIEAGSRDGYLVKAGLIASPENVRAVMTDVIRDMPPLAIGELE
ncbi:substrate-binding domain-containing protein [Sphingorhabdus sp. 109]|jgi:phosphate transport system substrate-binding protein|uniref:substrate-binding domain-containing protein n=1 Tax=Sphingorhabdus sp. 109 TaxID=2653173 RepID=UPI0012F3A144|nr:substrate-binding domain-containing protein [Sphingorhabdus sp. 109]VWX57468.1 Phosphate-binding protein PstS [Sphingorhabdus sp. 109]